MILVGQSKEIQYPTWMSDEHMNVYRIIEHFHTFSRQLNRLAVYERVDPINVVGLSSIDLLFVDWAQTERFPVDDHRE
jgi:hypothetical protein